MSLSFKHWCSACSVHVHLAQNDACLMYDAHQLAHRCTFLGIAEGPFGSPPRKQQQPFSLFQGEPVASSATADPEVPMHAAPGEPPAQTTCSPPCKKTAVASIHAACLRKAATGSFLSMPVSLSPDPCFVSLQGRPRSIACPACRTARLTQRRGPPCAVEPHPSQSARSPARGPPTR